MKILIVEDDDEKCDIVTKSVEERFPLYSISFIRADSVADFSRKVNTQVFDLMIFDILLPHRNGDVAFDLSLSLLDECQHTKNSTTPAIALTAMASPEYDTLLRFNERSIPVLQYDANSEKWVNELEKFISGMANISKFDFAICCALPKESNAFSEIGYVLGDWNVEKDALRWRSIAINDLKGVLCVFPKMGMTHSALYTNRVIDSFHPPLIAMSGICAGLKSECNLLDVIVPETSWDHQVGKITDAGLQQEIHSENMDSSVVAALRHYWETCSIRDDIEKTVNLEDGIVYRPSLVIGPVASGSVVVASASEVSKIEGQQRKVVGVEMEFAAFFAACRFSSDRPIAFGAKAVVDFADAEKDDSVQDLASVVSAKYVASMVPLILRDFS